MTRQTVDEFVIELSLSDKVTKGLTQLENKVKTVSGRMEKNLTNAFNKDFTRPLQQSFSRLETQARKTSANINRSFATIGKNQVNGQRMFKQVGVEARRAAAEAQRALNGIRPNPTGGGAGGRRGGAGRPTVTPQERAFNRFTSSAGFRNLQNAGGGASIRAREIQSQLSAHLARAGTSQNNVNAILTRAQSQLQAESQRLRSTLQNSSRALQNHTGQVTSASHGLAGFTAGLISVHSALEVFKASLDAGMKRQSVNTSAGFVFGKYSTPGNNEVTNAQRFADDMASTLGLSFNDTLQGLTKFVASAAPSMGVAGSEDFYKTQGIFGRLMGLNDDQMKHASLAFEQMAGKGTISAEELKGQLAEAMPGAEQLFAKAYTGSDDAKGVAKLLADMKNGLVKSADVLPKVNAEMQRQIQANGGLEKIAGMTSTALGKLHYNMENWLVAFEQGYDHGFDHLLNSISSFFEQTGELGHLAGDALGFVFDTLGATADFLGTLFMHINGWMLKGEAWYEQLDGSSKKLVDDGRGVLEVLGSFITNFLLLKGALFALNTLLGGGALARVISMLGGGAGVATAEAGAVGAGRFIPGVGQVIGGYEVYNRYNKLSDSIQEGTGTQSMWEAIKQRFESGGWAGAMTDEQRKNGVTIGGNYISPAMLTPTATQQPAITKEDIGAGVAAALKTGAFTLDLNVNGKASSYNIKPWEEGQNHMSSFLDIDFGAESPYVTQGH